MEDHTDAEIRQWKRQTDRKIKKIQNRSVKLNDICRLEIQHLKSKLLDIQNEKNKMHLSNFLYEERVMKEQIEMLTYNLSFLVGLSPS